MAKDAVETTTSNGRWEGLAAWSERHFRWLIMAPAILVIVSMSIYPMIYSLWVSFVNYDFEIPGHAFVGLLNFKQILADPVALQSVVVTAIFTVADVTIEFLLGLGLALAMVKNFRGRGVIMSVLIVPLFVAPVIVGQNWALFLERPFGPADYILGKIFGHPVNISWLTQMPWDFIAIIIADVWQWTPFMFVIMLAGLTAVPSHLYEAAELDGVGGFKAFYYITLPLMAPVMLLAITFRLLQAVQLFDVIFMMTGGGPGTSTYTTSYYLYQIGFQQFHLSMATAGSWLFLILIGAVSALLVHRLLKAEQY